MVIVMVVLMALVRNYHGENEVRLVMVIMFVAKFVSADNASISYT